MPSATHKPPATLRARSTRALAALVLAGWAGTLAGQTTSAVTRAAADTGALRVDSTQRVVGVLRSGDLLKVHVYRDSELSGEHLIDSRGNVQIPGLGVIRAAGLDPTQVTERLVAALKVRGFSNPEISVQPLVRVSVLGEVRNPALYSVEPGTSLIQLLTMAGGPGERADLERTRVVRSGRAFTVDLKSALGGSASGRVVLYSNDVMVIPSKRAVFTRENIAFLLSGVSTVLAVVNLLVALRR